MDNKFGLNLILIFVIEFQFFQIGLSCGPQMRQAYNQGRQQTSLFPISDSYFKRNQQPIVSNSNQLQQLQYYNKAVSTSPPRQQQLQQLQQLQQVPPPLPTQRQQNIQNPQKQQVQNYIQSQNQNQACPSSNPGANKHLVVSFYQRTFGDRNLNNLEQFLLPSFIQHNSQAADGIEGFKSQFRNGIFGSNPKIQINFQRASAEGDLVWLHVKLPIGGKTFSVVNIFRIQCGKIAEHWDVMQELTSLVIRSAKNSHPFF